jgi:hypothetical protein
MDNRTGSLGFTLTGVTGLDVGSCTRYGSWQFFLIAKPKEKKVILIPLLWIAASCPSPNLNERLKVEIVGRWVHQEASVLCVYDFSRDGTGKLTFIAPDVVQVIFITWKVEDGKLTYKIETAHTITKQKVRTQKPEEWGSSGGSLGRLSEAGFMKQVEKPSAESIRK